MPVMRKIPEKLFSKVIVCEGYGFNTPQDGSICKIKVILDEANLISEGVACKEIVVGDVDEPVDRLIEDCVRTMKEDEECYIEFPNPGYSVDTIILVDSCDDKSMNGCPENTKSNADNIASDRDDTESKITPGRQLETVKFRQQENDTSNVKTKELNDYTSIYSNSSHIVKIQFQLLSYITEPEIWEMSIREKWHRASYHKQRGLELYTQGVYEYAFRRFGLTLKYVISLEHDGPLGQEMDIEGLKFSCYFNIAACQMKHHNCESGIINLSKALDLQPSNIKALYKRGTAYLQLQEYENAKEDLTSAQHLEPKNQAITKQLQVLKSCVQKLNQHYASAMKKMFS